MLAIDNEAWDDFMGDEQFPNTNWYADDITEAKEARHLIIALGHNLVLYGYDILKNATHSQILR